LILCKLLGKISFYKLDYLLIDLRKRKIEWSSAEWATWALLVNFKSTFL
jgi:hypothetical protein